MKIIIQIAFFLSLIYISTSKDIAVYLQKCLSSCNKKYCNISTVCRPINRTSKLSSVHIYFHPGIKLEAPIYIEITAYKKFTTVYRPHMFKMRTELCAQLLLKNHHIFGLIEKAGIVLIGNLLDPCPFSGHRYTADEITHPNKTIFPLIPVGEWKFEVIISKNVNDSNASATEF